MKVTPTDIPDVVVVECIVHGDERGFFVERFQTERFHELGLPTQCAQVNHSRSRPGVLRGLHYQYAPPQGKLVGVTRGRIWDVAVDIRPDSDTFGCSAGIELSDVNGRLLWIPPGFAHGFCVLSDEPADVVYQTDSLYNPETEGGIAWDDPELAVAWPTTSPIVSARDRVLPSFAAYRAAPLDWGHPIRRRHRPSTPPRVMTSIVETRDSASTRGETPNPARRPKADQRAGSSRSPGTVTMDPRQ